MARKNVDQDSRAFAIALWRICHGNPGPGGVTRELANLTGLTPNAIRDRIEYAECNYPPDPIEQGGECTPDDLDYRDAIHRERSDPVTRQFFSETNTINRKRPDREDERVTRQKINGKLISIARDFVRF